MLTAALATTAALLTSVQDVFPRGDAHAELRRVHPVTLAPVGAPVRLAGHLQGGWTRRGSKLALGVSSRGRVQIVDGRASRVLQTGRRTAYWLLSWPRADRVLGLGTIASGRSPVAVLDPGSGRVLHDALIEGDVVTGVATAEGLAVLVAPAATIGEAALVLIDAEGAERRIALPGVLAGSEPPGQNPEPRSVMPALAVRDGRAYVATDARVVEVDLAGGEQRAHPVFGARAAKRAASQRSIQFVGPHALAVSGLEVDRPVGLRVVDTRTWAVKRISGAGRGSVALPGGGLAAWPSRRGLALHDADGTRRATVLRGRSIVQVQTAGRYAYAVTMRPAHRTYVVDVRSGRVVKTLPTAQPGRLLG